MRRTKEQLVFEILHHAQPVETKTRLVNRTYLNFTILTKYLRNMIEKGLIEKVGDRYYRPTEKGHDYMHHYLQLRSMMW